MERSQLQLNNTITFLFICLFSTSLYAQEYAFDIPDSLQDKSFDYIFSRFQDDYNDTLKAKIYLKTYLKKAEKTNNKLKKAQALNYLSYYVSDKQEKFNLLEKSILESQDLNDEYYPIVPYSFLGSYYHDNYEYEKALEKYLEVFRLSKKHNNKDYEYIALHNIAILKSEVGKHEEALDLFRKCFMYETSKTYQDTFARVETMVDLAKSYRYNKKYDSASFYYKQIIKESNPKTKYYLDLANINEGINLYNKRELKNAEFLLKKGISKVNTNEIEGLKHYTLGQLYRGKIKLELYNDIENAKKYFLKVDSLLTLSNHTIPETRQAYEFLIKYHKQAENKNQHLETINKLLTFDSILFARKINTVNRLYSEFDTPELLKNKEDVIQSLEKKTKYSTYGVIGLILIIITLITLAIFQFKKQKFYKKRFNEIVTDSNPSKENTVDKTIPAKTKNKDPKEINIDQTIVNTIMEKLSIFESNNDFLQNDLNATKLAKEFSTNTKYLSKVINVFKEQSFTNYINDLRIDYILKELQHNSRLRKYTIKGISQEAGFNTAESFASAFKKRTGLNPSYFIKNLNSKKN